MNDYRVEMVKGDMTEVMICARETRGQFDGVGVASKEADSKSEGMSNEKNERTNE